MKKFLLLSVIISILVLTSTNCNEKKPAPSPGVIVAVNLKRGPIISCNPEEKALGSVHFDIDYNKKNTGRF